MTRTAKNPICLFENLHSAQNFLRILTIALQGQNFVGFHLNVKTLSIFIFGVQFPFLLFIRLSISDSSFPTILPKKVGKDHSTQHCYCDGLSPLPSRFSPVLLPLLPHNAKLHHQIFCNPSRSLHQKERKTASPTISRPRAELVRQWCSLSLAHITSPPPAFLQRSPCLNSEKIEDGSNHPTGPGARFFKNS